MTAAVWGFNAAASAEVARWPCRACGAPIGEGVAFARRGDLVLHWEGCPEGNPVEAAVLAEREACARIVESGSFGWWEDIGDLREAVAAMIRARGSK